MSQFPSLSSVPSSDNISLPVQETIADYNSISSEYNIPQTPIKLNSSKYPSRILKFKVNLSRLALQLEPSMTPMSSPLPISSPVLGSSPNSNPINNENIIKKPGKKPRLSTNTGSKTIRKKKTETATVIVINVGDTSQKHQEQQNLTVNGPKTGSTPLLPSKLGPKANTGVINAGLRALDRSGKPCKKWYKRKITIDCVNGIQWEVDGWKNTSAS